MSKAQPLKVMVPNSPRLMKLLRLQPSIWRNSNYKVQGSSSKRVQSGFLQPRARYLIEVDHDDKLTSTRWFHSLATPTTWQTTPQSFRIFKLSKHRALTVNCQRSSGGMTTITSIHVLGNAHQVNTPDISWQI